MSGNAYTQDQILSGLRIIWREALDYEAPILPEIRFADDFKAGGNLEEIDFADVICRIQGHFGFTCAWEDWQTFLGWCGHDPDVWERDVAPRLTFAALADFIRERLEPISLEPITLLGKPCRSAGIFRALERLAGQVHPRVCRFGPSTPIRARLRGIRLRRFWSRLRWILEDQIPAPPRITLTCGGLLFILLFNSSIGLLVSLWSRDLVGLAAGFVGTFVLLFPLSWAVVFINSRLNPLPKGIETFGDLARYLAVITVDQQPQGA